MPVMNDDGVAQAFETHRRMKQRMEEADLEGALEDAIWFWEHALEHEPSQYGVRLSFFLSNLVKLSELHKPARDYMDAQRTCRLEALERGEIDDDGFNELTSIDERLNGPETFLEHFATLERTQPELARECGPMEWRMFYQLGVWTWIERYPPDAQKLIRVASRRLENPETSESLRKYYLGKAADLREVLLRLGNQDGLAQLDEVLNDWHGDESS